MSNIVAVEASNMLNASLGIASYSAATTPMKLALISGTSGANTSNSTASAAGTEVTGGSYARLSLATLLTTSSAGSNVTNNAALNFTNMPATTTYGVEIYDSAATPVRKWFGSLTASKATNAGDTLSFATSALSIGLQ